VFTSSDVVPTTTGGVLALGSIPMGGSADATQTFLTAYSTAGKRVVVIDVALTYYDDDGTSYTDKFTLSVTAKNESTSGGTSGGGGGGYVAPTPRGTLPSLSSPAIRPTSIRSSRDKSSSWESPSRIWAGPARSGSP
jgi:hypothetical protein